LQIRVDFCMDHIRIMVANEPRAYREAIGSTLWELRPQTQVTIATPEELDGEILRLHPHVVVCSELTEAVREHAMTWIVLYPDGKPLVVVSIAGEETHPADLMVDSLVEIVDRTIGLVQASPASLQIMS